MKHQQTDNKSLETLIQKIGAKDKEITKLNQEMATLKQDLWSVCRNSAKTDFIFTINNFKNSFETSKKEDNILKSKTFFCLDGYKARLNVYLNGYEDNNPYISVFFHSLKGPLDEELQWPMPFRKVDISLFINGVMCSKESLTLEDNIQFPKPNNEGGGNFGFPKFYEHLKIPANIIDDKIQFKVAVFPIK